MAFFGTDGIRGKFGEFPVNRHGISLLALAIISQIGDNRDKPIVICKDTRESSDKIEEMLSTAFSSNGIKVIQIGILPTNATSIAIEHFQASFAIMITASHNLYYDNGVKIFDSNGKKLADDIKRRIEEFILGNVENRMISYNGDHSYIFKYDFSDKYLRYLVNYIEIDLKLPQLSPVKHKANILFDCANGATSFLMEKISRILGDCFNVLYINHCPNGRNINDQCGSMHLGSAQEYMTENNIDLAFSFDGDGDRVIILLSDGKIIDGDKILAFLCEHLLSLHKIDRITVTRMSNSALSEFLLRKYDIQCIETDIGDQNISNILQNNNDILLGGENSGHILLRGIASSDSILVSVLILYILNNSEIEANNLMQKFDLYNEYLRIEQSITLSADSNYIERINEIESMLANYQDSITKKVVRKSGTEPKIRIMIESKHHNILCEINQLLINLFNT